MEMENSGSLSWFTVATQSQDYFEASYWFNAEPAGRQGQRATRDSESDSCSHAPSALGFLLILVD